MKIEAMRATESDVPVLEGLYRSLEKEMTNLHSMWPVAGGLDEPVADSLREEIEDPRSVVLLGEVEGHPFGFLLARYEELAPQAGGERVGSIRLIYVDEEAREVSVGEVMRDTVMDIMREQGITKFDAHVLPGHRLAKNFFEAGGFAARSIIMHHDDDAD